MANFFKKLSLVPQGLRYKLLIAFTLMSIIPLLVLTYLVTNFIITHDDVSLSQMTVIVLFSVMIAWLGLILAKNLVEPIIDMSIEAKIIAGGDFERKIHIGREDEIGELGISINLLSRRIKDNVQELRDYSEKTKQINIEIQKKMLALSNLLQIGDLISASADMDKILDVVLEKLSQFYDDGFAIAYLPKEKADEFKVAGFSGIRDNELLDMTINSGEGFLGEVIQTRKITVLDKSNQKASKEYQFKEKYRIRNAVAIPLYTGRISRGLIILGNNLDDFAYTPEDIDTITVFGKQLSIAVETDMLNKKTEMLVVKDDLTDLYNKKFIIPRLDEEIKRAGIYQRPCSFIIMNIDKFKEYRANRGQLVAETALKNIANALVKNLGPVEKAARIGDDEFAILLPEKNKKAACGIAEKIRKDVEELKLPENDKLTASIGVSENPLDGATASDIFTKALDFVKKAKGTGKNKVVFS